MEKTRYWMITRRSKLGEMPFLSPSAQLAVSSSSYNNESWEEQAFAKDSAGDLGGCIWPPRSYSCTFCRREFRSAQALGGHMNIHRKDRAMLKQSSSSDGAGVIGEAALESSQYCLHLDSCTPPYPPPSTTVASDQQLEYHSSTATTVNPNPNSCFPAASSISARVSAEQNSTASHPFYLSSSVIVRENLTESLFSAARTHDELKKESATLQLFTTTVVPPDQLDLKEKINSFEQIGRDKYLGLGAGQMNCRSRRQEAFDEYNIRSKRRRTDSVASLFVNKPSPSTSPGEMQLLNCDPDHPVHVEELDLELRLGSRCPSG